MSEQKKHTQEGLGGLQSDCAGGWHRNDYYVSNEPKAYVPPPNMMSDVMGRKEPKPLPQKKTRKRTTKKQDTALLEANTNDLHEKGIK